LLREDCPLHYHAYSANLAGLGTSLEPQEQLIPKRVAPLSARTLTAVQPGAKTIELVDGFVPGLRVRIFPNGSRTWSLNIRDSSGVRRRFDVGNGLGLADARRKAEDLRGAIREGQTRPRNAALLGSAPKPPDKA
jgi:hypothetical protein